MSLIGENIFQIHEFKLEKMVAYPSILIIGKQGCGKKWIQKDILYHFRDIPGGLVISPRDEIKSFYKHFFPNLYVHHEVTKSTINRIILRQIFMIEREKNNKDVNSSAIIVMDNCLSGNDLSNNYDVIDILTNSRGYKLVNIFNINNANSLTLDIIMNFDYVFLLSDDNNTDKNELWNILKHIFPTKESFEKIFTECTKNYGALVIDNKKISDNFIDQVYWFKAKERNFIFGSEKFIDMHKQYYNPENENVLTDILSVKHDELSVDYKNNELPQDDYLFGYFVNENNSNIESKSKPENPNIIETYSSGENNMTPSDTNTDYLFDYFMNNDNLETSKKDNKIKTNTHSEISIGSGIESVKETENEYIKLEYFDNSYELNAKITNLNNHKVIELLCNHIVSLKLMKDKQ
ncbi:VV A32 virion packaging ATPase [Tupanvirus soda lake]|uniref:VV A32 virion packaging ATPase n=2 Tax=Tupanvirus TaxID=2094720 RepID=A0A6N1NI78_9VIRU|nr:VV A32 virion packaging ATPase [Tupanvirus soda lake]QKU34764.1 VV A32 virion packaging ATPase [Tupanvirus soda lake]